MHDLDELEQEAFSATLIPAGTLMQVLVYCAKRTTA